MAEKRTCPACGSHLSSIYRAFEDGGPCPECGLPAAVAKDVERYALKGIAEEITERVAQAEQRAAEAERQVAWYRAQIQRCVRQLEEPVPGPGESDWQ